ncbi:MAG: FAD-dependent monooxygenase [Ignavibacteria bacterium]|nr:FAD-dependent monooxygenase [Ignavibacteria bacterium]
MGNKITLVGAGLAGSLLAVYLAKKGFEVNVYEKRSDMRKGQVERGRSINLALSTRGIFALKEIGLYEEIKKIAIPMYGRMMHPVEGELMFQRYGKDDTEYINSVSRSVLNMKLMDLAEQYENIKIHFNNRCTGMNLESGECHFTNDNTGENFSVTADTVIGTDGSASALRMEMLKLPGFNFSQTYLEHGYKELNIPPAQNGGFRMEKNALHIWPRGTFMLIALPNLDGSFTCTLFHPSKGEEGLNSLNTKEKAAEFFKKYFPDSLSLIENLEESFFTNPTGNLMTVRSGPWFYKDKVALLGDAAHAIVPFFGQGMNASFEDCTVLNQSIEKHGTDWEKVYSEYYDERKINTDAIADLALENFIEMRDKIADKRFLLNKQIEAELFKRFPDTFVPKYSMVTFYRFPYSTALQRGNIQQEILDALSEGKSSISEVDFSAGEKLVKDRLSAII